MTLSAKHFALSPGEQGEGAFWCGRAALRKSMFKRFDPGESVSSFSQVKSSQGRAIRAKLAELYPAIEPLLDDLLPKKDPILVAKCQNHVTMVLKDREPLFFQVSASGEVWRARDHYSRRVSAPSRSHRPRRSATARSTRRSGSCTAARTCGPCGARTRARSPSSSVAPT